MNLQKSVESVNILNIDSDLSNMYGSQLITCDETKISNKQYIVSDADEELLILIKFKNIITLKSITIYASTSEININDEEDISSPNQIHIYKLQNLSVNFDDIHTLRPDKSLKCLKKKLTKGQKIKLHSNSKLSMKFNKIQYLAIYIESNQNETEKTILNAIKLIGDNNDKDLEIKDDADEIEAAHTMNRVKDI